MIKNCDDYALLMPPAEITFKDLRNDKEHRKYLKMLDKYMPVFKDAIVIDYKMAILSKKKYSIDLWLFFNGEDVHLTLGRGF